jgi:DNA-binding transcriptional regulator GbsR (MarR family)
MRDEIIFDAIDEKIIRTMYKVGIPMTLGEISSATGISWITIKRHIKRLLELEVVMEVITDTRKNPKVVWNFQEYGGLTEAIA